MKKENRNVSLEVGMKKENRTYLSKVLLKKENRNVSLEVLMLELIICNTIHTSPAVQFCISQINQMRK